MTNAVKEKTFNCPNCGQVHQLENVFHQGWLLADGADITCWKCDIDFHINLVIEAIDIEITPRA